MKKVKFNIDYNTNRMIPDELYDDYLKESKKIRREIGARKFAELIYSHDTLEGFDFEPIMAIKDEIHEVSDWWYEIHKNDIVDKPINNTNEKGPYNFNMDIKYGIQEMPEYDKLGRVTLIKAIKVFELVEEETGLVLDEHIAPKEEKRIDRRKSGVVVDQL